jgi:hypothetical protein
LEKKTLLQTKKSFKIKIDNRTDLVIETTYTVVDRARH